MRVGMLRRDLSDFFKSIQAPFFAQRVGTPGRPSHAPRSALDLAAAPAVIEAILASTDQVIFGDTAENGKF